MAPSRNAAEAEDACARALRTNRRRVKNLLRFSNRFNTTHHTHTLHYTNTTSHTRVRHKTSNTHTGQEGVEGRSLMKAMAAEWTGAVRPGDQLVRAGASDGGSLFKLCSQHVRRRCTAPMCSQSVGPAGSIWPDAS